MITGLNILILFFVGTFGLMVGSFLNVLIFRMDDLKSVIKGRSHCPHCKHILAWSDLVPLFSFLFLMGKCRYCKKKISWQYPIVEAITGATFAILYSHINNHPITLIYYGLVFSLLIVIMAHDYKTQYIPENFMIPALLISFILGWYFGKFSFWNMLLGGAIGAGIPAFLVIISKEKWMGRGDIEVGLTLGLILGFPTAILGFFMACLLGSVYGLVLIAIKNKTIKERVPFAPSLILSTLISLVWGQAIVNWYLNTLF